MSKLLILVGCPGAGKTYRAKQLIENVNKGALHIFDVNAEYQDYYPYPFDGDMDIFIDKAKRLKRAVIVIEDATGFLPVNGRNVSLVQCIQGRRHTGNTFILLFHSMQDVPKYILRFCNAIFIFKTLDRPAYVESTFLSVVNNTTDLYTAWKGVYDEAKTHKFFSRYPPPPGVEPPMAVFSQY